MTQEKGSISIHTENILPIIKKWLYSDKDIFVREMISNATDAISKRKRLTAMGELASTEEKYKIRVILNKKKKTIAFADNGVGMTDEEVKKYINQIAFSGALDFIEKYKDKASEGNDIIGHFGLGFYSVFMVSEKVTIDTLSCLEGAAAVRWTSVDGAQYQMEDIEKEGVGTTITLKVNKDGEEFLEEFKMMEVLKKYCSFMPYEIYIEDELKEKDDKKQQKKKKSIDEAKKAVETEAAEKTTQTDNIIAEADVEKGEAENENETDGVATEEAEETGEEVLEEKGPQPINDTNPLWLKDPKKVTDDEYKEFYRKVFMDFSDPLFWIHLNMDYPFRLKGILYFPRLRHEFEMNEGKIKLYNNQVFVADNIKEVIPEFLLLLKGTLDCPDIPLNVSRSFLQNDGYVNKISAHITKKVADKLSSLYKNEKESYNKYWNDINPFVKYGCMRDDKFYEKVKDIVIYKTTKDDYVTLQEYLERNKDKHEKKVFYVTDLKQQAQYINLFKEHEMEAVILNSMIDAHFIQFLESKERNTGFLRVDSDISDNMRQKDETVTDNKEKEETAKKLEEIFKNATGIENLKVNVENLKSESVPAMIFLSEHSRRLQDMSRLYGDMGMSMGMGMFPGEETLVLNIRNGLIKKLIEMKDLKEREEDVRLISRHIYDLALMAHKPLEADAMTQFIERSNKILERI